MKGRPSHTGQRSERCPLFAGVFGGLPPVLNHTDGRIRPPTASVLKDVHCLPGVFGEPTIKVASPKVRPALIALFAALCLVFQLVYKTN